MSTFNMKKDNNDYTWVIVLILLIIYTIFIAYKLKRFKDIYYEKNIVSSIF